VRRRLALGAILVCGLGTACTDLLGVTDIPNPADAGLHGETSTPDGGGDGCASMCSGTCTMGRCLVTLATNQDGAYGLVVGAGLLYWTTESAVSSVNIGGGFVETIAHDQDFPLGIALAQTGVVWANSMGGSIAFYSLASQETSLLLQGLETPVAVATDAENVYFTTLNEVAVVPIGGGVPAALATDQLGPDAIVVDTQRAYWVNAGSATNGTVMQGPKSPADGGGLLVLASNLAGPQAIAIDAKYVYWTNAGSTCVTDGTVMRVPIGGGTIETLATNQASPIGIGIDSTDVYWANNEDGTVRKAPIAGGADTILVSGQNAPSALGVDSANVYFTTEGGDTVMQVTKE
jgi:hypothetical protein